MPIEIAPNVAMASLASARQVLLAGDGAQSLAMLLTARSVSNNKTVVFVSGDNNFDPYTLAKLARSRGIRAEDALRSVLVARAFTAFQFVELVSRLESTLPALSIGRSKVSREPGLIVISGPCSAFFDEDISLVDAARLFYRTLWRIASLAAAGRRLLLAESAFSDMQYYRYQPRPNKRRSYFLTDLSRACDVVIRLEGKDTFKLERHRSGFVPSIGLVASALQAKNYGKNSIAVQSGSG